MKVIEPDHQPLIAIRNGVDLNLFKPANDRAQVRAKLALESFTLLMVGNLVELKGHALVIRALAQLPAATLIIIGEGELEQELKLLAKQLNLENRINFVGGVQQSQLPDFYAAADCLVLASSREGWANVLLESMACGTPVVATKVWGTPEVVSKPEAGLLINRDVDSIKQGIEQFISNNIDRNKTRQYAQEFSWSATSTAQYELFEKCIAQKNKIGIRND
ncbi:MAG: glycosyltransferase, partial [Colwellia sp.]|nr:glycosyltransferase [Colwellia sp.]